MLHVLARHIHQQNHNHPEGPGNELNFSPLLVP